MLVYLFHEQTRRYEPVIIFTESDEAPIRIVGDSFIATRQQIEHGATYNGRPLYRVESAPTAHSLDGLRIPDSQRLIAWERVLTSSTFLPNFEDSLHRFVKFFFPVCSSVPLSRLDLDITVKTLVVNFFWSQVEPHQLFDTEYINMQYNQLVQCIKDAIRADSKDAAKNISEALGRKFGDKPRYESRLYKHRH